MRKHDDQWTLGQLIDALEKRPADQSVRLDFASLCPYRIDSFRGYYEDLAIGYGEYSYNDPPMNAGQWLARLREAEHQTFVGYKGGDYPANRGTPLWVANYGESGCTIVTGIDRDVDYSVLIRTRYAP